jgi:hypothetical protein
MANKQKRILSKAAQGQRPAEPSKLSRLVSSALSLHESDSQQPFVALKYYLSGWECFSAWQPDELSAFSDFCRKLGSMTWQQIYEQGGRRGNKTGLAFTLHDENANTPEFPFLGALDLEIKMFELRVTQKVRVHGFRVENTFFLVLLDREHRVYPE